MGKLHKKLRIEIFQYFNFYKLIHEKIVNIPIQNFKTSKLKNNKVLLID